MPKLSITLAATALSIGFAPALQAYGTEPGPDALQQVIQVGLPGSQVVRADDTCTVPIEPLLATILGLDDTVSDEVAQTTMACIAE